MGPRLLLRPSLLRTLLLQMLALAVMPLVLLSAAFSYVSDRIVLDRFREQSEVISAAAAKDLADFVTQANRSAALIAELQQTRDALASGDQQRIKAELLPLKSRLGFAIVSVADTDGRIIAGAQDPRPNDLIGTEMLRRMQAQADSAWTIDGDEQGALTLRAVAPVRRGGTLIGIVEVGAPFDATFLRSLQHPRQGGGERTFTAELALIWRGTVRTATFSGEPPPFFPSVAEVEAARNRELTQVTTIARRPYHAIYTLVETRQQNPLLLGAFLSLEPVESARLSMLALLASAIVSLAIAITILAYRFANGMTGPLRTLASAAQGIAAGDLAIRIPQRSPHEIGVLERRFDTMSQALTERDKANRELVAELQVQALSDLLTGLPNRTLLQDRLRQTILIATRQRTRFALLMLDLDRFKEVNDAFGHQTGDSLLVAIGERLRETLRDADTLARFGGDEFAVLLPTADSPESAIVVARKIERALQRTIAVGPLTLNVEASIGIALYPLDGEDPSTLVKHADAAMYVAKQSKSGHALYQMSDDRSSRDSLVLMGEFREAITREELVLHYQPEADPRTHEITALEALVRWQHPERGLLGPDRFIPFAEQSGLIRPLTAWVVGKALEQASIWQAAGHPVHIAVNLSARDFEDPLLPGQIAEALRRWGVPARHLKLEITEGVVMAEAERSLETLTRLSEMGVRLSIDDFGTGYSSLSYLRRLPVDEIKIDRSFVIDIVADRGTAAIVRSTIELSHSLGRTIVAEGVEDEATIKLLASYGCDSVQGYSFSPAIPASEVDENLRTRKWTLRQPAVSKGGRQLSTVGR